VSQVEILVRDLRAAIPRWRADPVAFVRETFPTDPEGRPTEIDEPQERILRGVAAHERTAVRSSHGIGKTCAAGGWLPAWWLATRYPARVVTAAGTWNHLAQKLWPELHVWYRCWLLRDQFELLTMEMRGWENPDGWRAVAAATDRPENIEGHHSPNLFIVTDEAKAMPDEVRQGLRGAQTGPVQREVVLSTPPLQDAGWYADLFSRKSEGWHLIHVTAAESARVSAAYIEEMARDYGEESAVYQAKVLGEIPTAAAGVVIQSRWIDEAQARGVTLPAPGRMRGAVLTCDVAREGEDLTVLGLIQDWKWRIPKLEDTDRYAWRATNDLMECAGLCLSAALQTRAVRLVIDDTGLGGGVTDRLIELQRQGVFPKDCFIVPVKFGAEPIARPDRFAKLKDELWWRLRNALRTGPLALPTEAELAAYQLPRGSDLRAQLSSPIYEEDSLSRIRVIDHRPSHDRRERYKALPTKSPDLAHAVILGVREYTLLEEDEAPAGTSVEFETRALHKALRQRLAEYVDVGEDARAPGFLE
jgi:hypothetical protein